MSRTARLGAFIVTTLAILAVGIFIIGDKQYLFTSTYQLKTQSATWWAWTWRRGSGGWCSPRNRAEY